MGRICSWCGTVLTWANGGGAAVSHVLCAGCLEELDQSLSNEGMQLGSRSDGAKPGL